MYRRRTETKIVFRRRTKNGNAPLSDVGGLRDRAGDLARISVYVPGESVSLEIRRSRTPRFRQSLRRIIYRRGRLPPPLSGGRAERGPRRRYGPVRSEYTGQGGDGWRARTVVSGGRRIKRKRLEISAVEYGFAKRNCAHAVAIRIDILRGAKTNRSQAIR